jgi:hypothetical protein
VESGGAHHHIDIALGAVGCDDAGLGELRDAVGDDFGLRVGDTAVIRVGVQDALAARPVVRSEFLAQLLVLHRSTDVPLTHQFTDFEQPRLLGHREPDTFVYPVDAGPHGRSGAGNVGEHPLHPRRDRIVGPRHHPCRRALVKVKCRNILDDLRDYLDGAGAGADHRDTFTGDVDAVVPFGGVEHRALEVAEPLEIGDRRDVQAAGAGNQELRNVFLAVAREGVPTHFTVVPVCAIHMGVEPDVAPQTVLGGHALQVILDLRLKRPHVGPVGLGLEGERVHVRRDVACTAGIGVVPPGAADVVGLLEDHEVDVSLLQLDTHAQAGEARADDQRAGVHRFLGRTLGRLLGNRHQSASPTPDTGPSWERRYRVLQTPRLREGVSTFGGQMPTGVERLEVTRSDHGNSALRHTEIA